MIRRARDRGHAEISPPPPIGTISVSIPGTSASISNRDRALSSDDAGIIERMDEGQAVFRLHQPRMR